MSQIFHFQYKLCVGEKIYIYRERLIRKLTSSINQHSDAYNKTT